MDFAIVGENEAGDAADDVRAQRGSDPLVTSPQGHLFDRIGGLPFRSAPGAQALHLNAIPYFLVEAVLMEAARRPLTLMLNSLAVPSPPA